MVVLYLTEMISPRNVVRNPFTGCQGRALIRKIETTPKKIPRLEITFQKPKDYTAQKTSKPGLSPNNLEIKRYFLIYFSDIQTFLV